MQMKSKMRGVRSKVYQDIRDVVIGLYDLGRLRDEERAQKVQFLLESRNFIYENIDVFMI